MPQKIIWGEGDRINFNLHLYQAELNQTLTEKSGLDFNNLDYENDYFVNIYYKMNTDLSMNPDLHNLDPEDCVEDFMNLITAYHWRRPPNTKKTDYAYVCSFWLPAECHKTEVALEKAWEMMQGHNWSPEGEARDLITALGLRHTSMSVGDLIEIPNTGIIYEVQMVGFKSIGSVMIQTPEGLMKSNLTPKDYRGEDYGDDEEQPF